MPDSQPGSGSGDAATRRRVSRDSQAMESEREKVRRARHGPALIRARPRAHYYHGVVLSLAFALVGTPLLMAPSWVAGGQPFSAGEPAPVTLRVPLFLGRAIDEVELRNGSIVVARGQPVEDAVLANLVSARQPRGWGTWLTYFAGLFMAGLLYTAQLARSHKGRLLRTQIVNLAVLIGCAAVTAAVFLLTPVSALAVPIAALAIVTALVVDLGAALATAVMAALVIGALTPFDPGVITVLAVQGAAAGLVVGERERLKRRPTRTFILLAGLLAGIAAALTYFLLYYLSHNASPVAELRDPLRSAWLAAGIAGPLGALIAMPALPLYQRALGDIPLSTLVELEDLSNPLLKRIAESSPGTWQHSLAMANMAEIAANAIGASGRLVRVGAYYHDLGKSLQPKYFIENLAGGESSPHDALPPGVSCDAIFAHVTEGVRVARKEGLHERIVDFMHMHHGDGLLEYFWAKCLESGNPDNLTEEDFRYPGVKPHSKETAILAICDAVEAASRTLRNPDAQAIENLVQRIVYGKLHLGQLDQSGLTVADLRRISASLVETIKHAHHGRIEYPWQRQKREAEEKEALTPREIPGPVERPRSVEEPDAPSATQRLLREPRLDSLDAPRPAWRARTSIPLPPRPPPGSSIENAPTEPLKGAGTSRALTSRPVVALGEGHAEAGEVTRVLRRPPTAAEVAMATAPEVSRPVQAPLAPRTTEPVEAAQIEESSPALPLVAEAIAGAEAAAPEPVADQVAEMISDPMADMVSDPGDSIVASSPPPDAEASTEWERALLKVAQTPAPLPGSQRKTPPPPPPPKGKNRLFEDDEEDDDVKSGRIEVVTRRPDSEDEALEPGVLVFGPPPATQPRAKRPGNTLRGTAHTVRRPDTPVDPAQQEVTVQRRIPIPPEAHAEDAEVDADGPTRPRSGLPPTDPE
ncbi:MAG TPA: HDIG domain-containing protein [Kofleriaceae bacterium]|nr:HDIG domain-containing protein [Kofleriaceae bacterium]